MEKKNQTARTILSIFLGILALLWVYPVVMILINSLKSEKYITTGSAFVLPNAESFAGIANYIEALGAQGFATAFGYSLVITVSSVILILLCTSMCAWYITRVHNLLSKVCYGLFVFSMVVPFQMLMFTLSSTADRLDLDTPFRICIIYLGFGAGLAVFMFTGFMKSIPLEIEEAAMIDGCGPVRMFFLVVFPMLRPVIISVGILELMWIWNDYLLPYLVLDLTKYRTIPIHVQYLKGSYGSVDMGASLAVIVMSLVPMMIVYILCQKHIVKGIAAGAVKG